MFWSRLVNALRELHGGRGSDIKFVMKLSSVRSTRDNFCDGCLGIGLLGSWFLGCRYIVMHVYI